MDTKAKKRIVRSLLKDFHIYARRYCPESKELVRRFQITKETKGTWEYIDCILHILKLDMSFMEDDSKKADRGLFHMCRDVMEWVYGTNKDFSGSPMASIIRDWVHKRVQPYKPFPTLNIETKTSKEDSDSKSDEEDRPDSGIGTPTAPVDDENKQEPQEDNKRPASPRTTDTPTKDAPAAL